MRSPNIGKQITLHVSSLFTCLSSLLLNLTFISLYFCVSSLLALGKQITMHCFVNWRRVQRPKQLGGLGIADLVTFNRALCLRWQWLQWKDNDKPWSELQLYHTPTEIELFRTCTSISLDDGRRALFWHDRWLQGRSPLQIALDFYRLAWRKKENVATALTDGKWKRGLRLLSTTAETNQYVQLWDLLEEVQLGEQSDDITWRFSHNGTYSSSSAYLTQFARNIIEHDWLRLWKSKVENKCKFFCMADSTKQTMDC